MSGLFPLWLRKLLPQVLKPADGHVGENLIYEPLAKGEIRVLCLVPSPDIDAEIQCGLFRTKLGSHNRYEALSYVWGERTPTREIEVIVNKEVEVTSMSAHITPNLFAALQRLRLVEEVRFLWVDALCINQEDDAEKGVQISMMGDIYKNCKRCLMWLGEEDGDSDLAIEMIGRVSKAMEDYAKVESHLSVVHEMVIGNEFSQHWDAIKKLLIRPYWQRVWTLQESVLPPCRYLCCGSSMAHWEGFQIVLAIISNGEIYQAPHAVHFSAHPIVARTAEMRLKMINNESISLLEALLLARNLDATEPQDKIYGILSLARHEGFDPSYGQPTLNLYRDVVKFIISQDQNLDILAACHHSKNKERLSIAKLSRQIRKLEGRRFVTSELIEREPAIARHLYEPSWVPDWRHPKLDYHYLSLNRLENCHYKACGNTKPSPCFSDDDFAMILDGTRVDDLQTISSTRLEGFKLGISGEHVRYGRPENQEAAFRRTIIGGRNTAGNKDTCNMQISKLQRCFEDGGDRGFSVSTNESSDTIKIITTKLYVFCVTSQGFMGLVPNDTQSGDVVVVFAGGRTPFVLRRYQDTTTGEREAYLLVGECYIDGIMEGEIMEEVKSGARSMEQFVLY